MGKGANQLISSQCQLHVVDKVFRTGICTKMSFGPGNFWAQNEGKMQVALDQNRFQRSAPRPCANTRDCPKTAAA